jgi:hypothetical protein
VIHLSRSSRRRHDTRTHAPSHVSTRPCTHARARAHVHLGGEKPSPFSLCSSIERSSPAFRRGEPRRRPLWCRSTQWCERQVLVELTRPFSCTHARSLADTSHPSRAAETPFHRARALLAAVPCPLHTGASMLAWPSIALHTSSPLHWHDGTPQATPASPSSTRCLPPHRA